MRILNFFKRNIKEMLRDPIVYIFCIAFPVIMLAVFQVINHYAGNVPMFKLQALLPGIIMFSYTFVMLTMTLLISKDRQTFFLKRLYSSPMKSAEYVLGYALVGVIIGVMQTAICILAGFIISLIQNADFINLSQILLLTVSQLPILLTCVFIGIIFGSLFNDKSAPGICSAIISLAGMLGGCWMSLEGMGAFEAFCRFLPFYPSVYIGRITTNAVNLYNVTYTFNSFALIGLITLFIYMSTSIVLSFILFKKNMTSDK